MEGLDVRGNSQAQHSIGFEHHGHSLRRSFPTKNLSVGVIDHFYLSRIKPPLGHLFDLTIAAFQWKLFVQDNAKWRTPRKG